MIRTTIKGLISELAESYFKTGSAASYQRLYQAIVDEGYSDPAQKIELLRVALGLPILGDSRSSAEIAPRVDQ